MQGVRHETGSESGLLQETFHPNSCRGRIAWAAQEASSLQARSFAAAAPGMKYLFDEWGMRQPN